MIAQANGAALEVLDADPGADQAIEHVFHRLERGQCCHLRWLGDQLWDATDVRVEAVFDRLELIEQPFDPIVARQLLRFPVLA